MDIIICKERVGPGRAAPGGDRAARPTGASPCPAAGPPRHRVIVAAVDSATAADKRSAAAANSAIVWDRSAGERSPGVARSQPGVGGAHDHGEPASPSALL